jgi:protein SCO1
MIRPGITAFALCAMMLASPACAALTKADLDAVGLDPVAGAKVPGELMLTESDGRVVALGAITASRPTLLLLVDFTCRTICGPVLSIVAADILRAGLVPGRDFNLLVIGIDPRETPSDAAAMKKAELADAPELEASAHFLSANAETFAQLSTAIGYRARYDEEARVFAHPAELLVLAPRGEVSRVLPGLALGPRELRLALLQAGKGGPASLGERFHVLCYGLDAAIGIYARPIEDMLWAAGALTLIGLAGGILVLEGRRRSGAQ